MSAVEYRIFVIGIGWVKADSPKPVLARGFADRTIFTHRPHLSDALPYPTWVVSDLETGGRFNGPRPFRSRKAAEVWIREMLRTSPDRARVILREGAEMLAKQEAFLALLEERAAEEGR